MMSFTRADTGGQPEGEPIYALTTQQRRILEVIDDYQRVTGEACPGSYLGRRFERHHSTMQKHLFVLFRKGWLRAPNAPAFLIRTVR